MKGDCKKNSDHIPYSDHIPLILESKKINWGPAPFKAFNFWLDNEHFKEWFHKKCRDYKDQNFTSSHNFNFWRIIKYWIKEWSKSNSYDYSNMISSLEEEITRGDKRGWSFQNKWKTHEHLQNAYAIRNSIIKQKARITWDLEGDSNTKFFHRFVKYRRRINHIHRVWENNQWISEPNDLKEYFLKFFKDLFGDLHSSLNYNLNALNPVKIIDQEAKLLSASFSSEEISKALYSLDSKKAPGLEGLKGAYVKFSWDFMKDDFMRMVKTFETNGSLPSGLNSSFITLPKMQVISGQ